jgi:secreted Zn-dependent insulinase-like peptidase
LVSDVIEKRLFAEKDETRKLQLLSISAFPDGFREYAFSLVLRSLESDDVKHQQLGYVIAKSWVGESKEKLTNRQLQAISDSAKSVLNDTSLPVEQRLASLQLLEVMPNI